MFALFQHSSTWSTLRKLWPRGLALLCCAVALAASAELGLRVRDRPNAMGVEVVEVVPGSVAAQAGIRAGDLVLQADGIALVGADQFVQRLGARAPTAPLPLRISRDGWERELVLQPDTAPASARAPAPPPATAAELPANVPAKLPAQLPVRSVTLLSETDRQAYVAELEQAAQHYQQANWPQAARYYQLAVQRVADEPATWGRLCHAQLMQQQFSQAILACRQSLALDPPQPSTLINLGYSHLKLGALDEAHGAYQRAAELAPESAPPYSGLGAVAMTRQDWAQAERYYRLALERDPNNAADRQALDGVLQVRRSLNQEQAAAASRRPPRDLEPMAPSITAPAQPTSPAPISTPALVAAAPGNKALIAVGDFQVKAAGAGQFIGDGLREMLVTTLHNSGRYVVVERMHLQGLAAEQALSRSRMARPGAAVPEGQMDVAEVMIYGAVTEFESEERGGGVQFGIGKLPLNVGRQTKTAHMAVDVRLVDVASGRLITAQRIASEASSSQTTLGTTVSVSGVSIPTSLGAFKNTPMEQAIRDCVQKATAYITGNTPAPYFRHR